MRRIGLAVALAVSVFLVPHTSEAQEPKSGRLHETRLSVDGFRPLGHD